MNAYKFPRWNGEAAWRRAWRVLELRGGSWVAGGPRPHPPSWYLVQRRVAALRKAHARRQRVFLRRRDLIDVAADWLCEERQASCAR